MPSFETTGHIIPYTVVRRPRRRRPAIQVDRDGEVRVLIPPGFRERDVPALLRAHELFLRRHVLERPPVAHTFSDGDRFFYRGEPVVLRLRPAAQDAAHPTYSDGILTLAALGPEEARARLRAWFLDEAAKDLGARVERWVPVVGRSPTGLRIRDYQSRWGYCRTDGLVAFNFRLIQAAPRVIDYVVVHELVHLRHPHHQPAFWAAVKDVFGEAATARAWLREHNRELYW